MTRYEEAVEVVADVLRDHEEFQPYERSLGWEDAKRVATDVVDKLLGAGVIS